MAAAIACGFVVGVLSLWDDIFGPQTERMEPWKQVAVWTGEIVAFVWFLQFIIWHSHGVRLKDRVLSGPQRLGLPIAVIMLGFIADGCVTGTVLYDEYLGFHRAKTANGIAIDIERIRDSRHDIYRMRVRFKSLDNVQYESTIRVTDFEKEGFPKGMRHAQDLRNLRNGFETKVRYDPTFPDRIWGEWEEWSDGIVRTHLLMLMLIAAQIGGLIWFAIELKQTMAAGVLPWWHEFYKIAPILGEAALLLFISTLFWFVRFIH